MSFRRLAVLVAPLATAVVLAAGTANAQATPDVRYDTALVGNQVVTTLTDGVFEVSGNSVSIRDTAGRTLVSLPLSYRLGGLEYPLLNAIRDEGRVLELTPVADPAQARPVPATPVASPEENQRAQTNFQSQLGIATAVGSFVGCAVGAAIGLIGVIAGPLGIATVATGCALGSVAGLLIAGGPTLIAAGLDLMQTLNAPAGTTRFADPHYGADN